MRLQRHLDIGLYCQPGKQRKGLKYDGRMRVHTRYRLATIQHLPRRGLLQTGNDAQQGTLATTGWPQERYKLALLQIQIDILQGDKAVRPSTICLVDMSQFDEGGRQAHCLLQT